MIRRVKPKNVQIGFFIRCSICGAVLSGQNKREVVNRADYNEWRLSDEEGIICKDCLMLRKDEKKLLDIGFKSAL